MKRIDREFCLTDSSVNCYGYRLLTDGLEIDRFRPPVGFLMHDRDKGVAVQWTDFRREGDAVFATPIVNDALFPELVQQIEEGFINAASVGHIVALEVSDDPDDKLPGQDGPTVKRWFPREISLVDIPGNYNALGCLFDENDVLLHDLSANNNNNKTTMNFKEFFPDLQSEDENEIRQRLASLKALADKAETFKAELDQLRQNADRAQAKALLDKAVAEHRVSQQLADRLALDYDGKNKELADLLALLPPRKSVPAMPTAQTDDGIASLSWDELDKKGLLPRLKAENPDLFTAKFNAKFKNNPNS